MSKKEVKFREKVSCAFCPKNEQGALHLRADVKNPWFFIALRNTSCISDEPAVFVLAPMIP